MRQHSNVRPPMPIRPSALPLLASRKPRRRFTACNCDFCRARTSQRSTGPWRRPLTLVVAGLLVGQLLVIGLDAAIGGPGPFAWIGLLFGKGLS